MPLQQTSKKTRVKEAHLSTMQALCFEGLRTYADSVLSVCEKRKMICFLSFGEIRQQSLVQKPSIPSFANPIVLNDDDSCAILVERKPGMFPSIVVPHGLRLAVVEQNKVWIVETRVESHIHFRFSLVLTNESGERVPSVKNQSGQELLASEAIGDWETSPTRAFKNATEKVRLHFSFKPTSNAKLLVGIFYDKPQELLRKCISSPAFNQKNANLKMSCDVDWVQDWVTTEPLTKPGPEKKPLQKRKLITVREEESKAPHAIVERCESFERISNGSMGEYDSFKKAKCLGSLLQAIDE